MIAGRKVILVCPAHVPAPLFVETRRRIAPLETRGLIDEHWMILCKYPLPSVEANEKALIRAAEQFGYRVFDPGANLGEPGNVNAFLKAHPQPPGTIYIKFDGDALTEAKGYDRAICDVLTGDPDIAVAALGIPQTDKANGEVSGRRVYYHPNMMRYDIAGTDLDFIAKAGGFRTPGTMWGGLESCIHEDLVKQKRRIAYLIDQREAQAPELDALKDAKYMAWKWDHYWKRFDGTLSDYLARTQLVSALVVRNEADRYLEEVLAQCLAISDHVIVWDDGSTDDTRAIAKRMGCEVHGTKEPQWATNESKVRAALYAKVMAHDPMWVYTPDADELLEFPERLGFLLGEQGADRVVYRFDMWHAWGSRDTFRTDGYWSGQKAPRLFRPPADGKWTGTRIHCGSVPAAALAGLQVDSGLRVFHLGYAREGDALDKYTRYSMLDPRAEFCPRSHYDSMLTTPTLVDKDGAYISGPRMESLGRGLRYPIRIGVPVTVGGITYPAGSRIDHATALAAKQSGQLRDERIV